MGIPSAALSGPVAGVGLAGTALNAAGTYEQGQFQQQMYNYQAAIQQNNAALARQGATWSSAAGQAAVVNQGLKTRAAIGQQRAAAGASGVDPNTGSEAAVTAGLRSTGMVNAATRAAAASQRSYGEMMTAQADTEQSALDRFAGQAAPTLADIGAAGTLLSGASTVGLNYLKMQNTGVA